MTLPERLIQTQDLERRIQEQIRAYQQEIERLTPQLWAVHGQVALLVELTQATDDLAD